MKLSLEALGHKDIDVGAMRDFADADAEAIVRLADDEVTARRPLTPRDAVLVEPGEKPARWRRHALAEHFRANGLSSLARQVANLLVPVGSVAIVLVGDSVRVFPFDLTGLDEVDTDETCTPPPGRVTGAHEPGKPWRMGRWTSPIPHELLATNGRGRR
jgi:hypothetical protein